MTNEIAPTLSHEEYRTQLASAIRAVASELTTDEEETPPYSAEGLQPAVCEYLTATGGLYLSHPISVIEHSEANLSHKGASRLHDVTSTRDFAQEHARDLYQQEIVTALAQIQEGTTIAGVQKNTSEKSDSPFAVSSDKNQQFAGSASSPNVRHDE